MQDIAEFADFIWERFSDSQNGIKANHSLNLNKSAVTNLVKSAFYASMKHDEGRLPRATIMCYPDTTHFSFHFLFPEPLPVTPNEIAKLAHAIGSECHLGCISKDHDLTIRGTHITRLRDRRDLGYDTFPDTNPLAVSIKGSGHIQVSFGGTGLAFNCGIQSEERLLLYSQLLISLEKAIIADIGELTEGYPESISAIIHDLVKDIANLGHGGLLLFSDDQSDRFFSKSQRVDSNVLQELMVEYWDHAAEHLGGPNDPTVYVERSEEEMMRGSPIVASDVEMLEKAVRNIARMSGMDGAIAMQFDCRVTHFNAIIGRSDISPSSFQFVNGENCPVSGTEFLAHRGSRHQASLSYVMQVPNSYAFVISQDGNITAMHRQSEQLIAIDKDIRVIG